MVLVHGGHMGTFAADLADDWDLNFDALARHYRVYALDKLGMGFTDNPKTDDGYTIQAQTDHVSRFMETLGIRAGASSAGIRGAATSVTRLALQHPSSADPASSSIRARCRPARGATRSSTPTRRCRCARANATAGVRALLLQPGLRDRGLARRGGRGGHTPNTEAVRKMSADGLLATKFLPDLQRDLEETHRWLLDRGLQRPTLMLAGATTTRRRRCRRAWR